MKPPSHGGPPPPVPAPSGDALDHITRRLELAADRLDRLAESYVTLARDHRDLLFLVDAMASGDQSGMVHKDSRCTKPGQLPHILTVDCWPQPETNTGAYPVCEMGHPTNPDGSHVRSVDRDHHAAALAGNPRGVGCCCDYNHRCPRYPNC